MNLSVKGSSALRHFTPEQSSNHACVVLGVSRTCPLSMPSTCPPPMKVESPVFVASLDQGRDFDGDGCLPIHQNIHGILHWYGTFKAGEYSVTFSSVGQSFHLS